MAYTAFYSFFSFQLQATRPLTFSKLAMLGHPGRLCLLCLSWQICACWVQTFAYCSAAADLAWPYQHEAMGMDHQGSASPALLDQAISKTAPAKSMNNSSSLND